MATRRTTKKSPTRPLAAGTEGAASPNRPDATSAAPRPRPAKAPKKVAVAGAGATAEMRRAAGVLEPRPEGSPVADATGASWAQAGDRLTTASGVRVDDADNSLTAGERGPTLLEDFHLREKIMHFDHERIPERVVHARGAGAHGAFEATDGARRHLRRGVPAQGRRRPPVFTRFSTVAGSRGSADTARDVRGFATKFYTERGQLRSGRQQHPGVLHPGRHQVPRPHPRGEARARSGDPPGADGARHVLGLRLPAAGVDAHADVGRCRTGRSPAPTPRWRASASTPSASCADDGSTSLVKFHWKPVAGVHGLVWEEAQQLGGIDPDFHRRDLNERIATGQLPRSGTSACR